MGLVRATFVYLNGFAYNLQNHSLLPLQAHQLCVFAAYLLSPEAALFEETVDMVVFNIFYTNSVELSIFITMVCKAFESADGDMGS